ncbi:uncharacterized protein KGF55_004384 [Candida pseudojiufengensis]|uniref:uncharacterized protein n=1 Tax=Candida pseudojiufengensis TaxID=497109 RepID=UPI0022245057|nr:uncharacterized protein KGF55_004384 [Candida pseudojiufengensis]KAI5960814.1 hypothetical protein KGF55_004384 [Candida pseudojiufengensis]
MSEEQHQQHHQQQEPTQAVLYGGIIATNKNNNEPTLEQLQQERERLKNIDAQLDKQVNMEEEEGEFDNSTQSFLPQSTMDFQLPPHQAPQPLQQQQQYSSSDSQSQQSQSQDSNTQQQFLQQQNSQNQQQPHPQQQDSSIPGTLTDAERRDQDSRSIYIGNVDYLSTPLELQQHFSSAGIVNRVTILMNKLTGQPKGFAYLEFNDIDGVNKAVATLDGSMFRERELKVMAKRTNIPGISIPRGNLRGRGRGGFRGGRGAFRGGRGGGGFRGGRCGYRGSNPRFNPY